MQFDEDLIRHVTQQTKVHGAEVLEGTADVEVQNASLRYNDPSAIALSRTRLLQAVDNAAADNDWATKKTQAMRLAATSSIHAAVLGSQMAAGQDIAARAYLKANREEIEPKVADQLAKALEVSSTRGESQRQFDRIVAKYPTYQERLQEARSIADEGVRDATEARINQQRVIDDSIEKDASDKRFLDATNTLDKTRRYESIPPADIARMTLQERAALQTYARHKLEGTQPTTNWGVVTKFYALAPEQQAKLTEADMNRKYRPHLDDAAYSHVLSRWQSVRDAQGKPEQAQKLSSTLQFDDQTLYTFRSVGGAGWDTPIAKFTPDQSKQYGMFRTEAAVIVESEERATGKEVAATRRQQILDQLVLRYTIARTERGWPDPHKLVIDMSMEERKAGYVELKNMIPANKGHLLSLARRIGAIPIEMTNAQAEKRFADRLQRAYFQAAEGASEEELAATLRGPR
jgi:hypothetical protein